MKQLLTFAVLFTGLSAFSQDIEKILQEGKWYAGGYPAKKKIILTRKPTYEKQVATVEFLPSGKISYCDFAEESYFDAEGNEKTLPAKFHCDTVEGYEIKNHMLRIYWNNVKSWHFKVAVNGEKVELTPVKPEDYR
jgi:hypothetical protein